MRTPTPDSSSPVRTRFAPSPTGYLHIGGARTALFNYLYSRQRNGSFVLRIEDTDKERNTSEAREAILDGLRWLGLEWDEGPFYQSERNDLYRTALNSLLDSGRAYRCECSPEELDRKRKLAQAEGRKPMYDGHCRDRNLTGDGLPIRFRVKQSGETVLHDEVRGDITYQNGEFDDFIIARSDGSPTYNFVVVVDDHDMQMSHVIRGDDHLNNTPKQLMLFEALDYSIPRYAHVPLILGPDKSRLSKRHGATSVQAYRDAGYLPEAMNNFLVKLGWSHKDQEIFSMDEMITAFNFAAVGKSSGIFNPEKLNWLNHHYMNQMNDDQFSNYAERFVATGQQFLHTDQWRAFLSEIRERCNTFSEIPKVGHYFFNDTIDYVTKSAEKYLTSQIQPALEDLRARLKNSDNFNETTVEEAFQDVLHEHALKMKMLAQAVRVALTGDVRSPGIYLLICIVGQSRTDERLAKAIEWIQKDVDR